MFTRNYYSLLALQRMIGSGSYAPITFTNTSGVLFNGYHSSPSGTAGSWMNDRLVLSQTADKGLFFGNGTTPPSLQDYTCSGEEIMGLSVVSYNSTVTYAENAYRCKATMILTNTSDEEVTISEVCRKANVMYSNSYSYGVVLERVVLDTPVVIPAGRNGTVEYITTIQIPV